MRTVLKDYRQWHNIKTQLNNTISPKRYYYEREVWWVSIGANIRFEEDGKGSRYARPVVILRKFNDSLFLGVPLSTTQNRHWFHHPIGKINGRDNVALISQIRTFDTNRLLNKMANLSDITFQELVSQIAVMIQK